MSTRHSFTDAKRPRERELVSLLAKADQALHDLQQRAACICQSGNLGTLGFRRRQIEELNVLLAEGAQALDGRLYTLDGFPDQVEAAAKERDFSRNALVEPITFFAAYRACCRALCAAMKEASRLADSSSALSLRGLILRLEKQLWTIDEPELSRGLEDRRAVSLFLSC